MLGYKAGRKGLVFDLRIEVFLRFSGKEVVCITLILITIQMSFDPSPRQPDERQPIKSYAYQHRENALDERPSVRNYAVNRITSFKPPMENIKNPFTLLAMLDAQQWAFFLAVSFAGWSWDSFDF